MTGEGRVKSRRQIIPVILLAGVLAGGPALFAQEDNPKDDVTAGSLKFAEIYALVEKNYVEPVEPDRLILEGAVRRILSKLDPFSAFFNEDQFELLRQQTQGRAVGFGSILSVTSGKAVVLQAAENSPSWRAGLGPGDEIVAINGQRIAGLDFRDLVDLLRRSRSRPVTLGIVHPGKFVPVDIKLNPTEVAMPSVDVAFLLKPGIAYIHLTSFGQKTPQEILDQVKRLGGSSLKGLLFDLRDNRGGVVDSAVAVVSLFVKPNQTVLTIKSRTEPEKRLATLQAPALFEMPLIVLVNGNTASAAEITAAALEEHDRALIVGEPTYGKGVVENISPIGEKMGLALTSAQYFTPSGRSIQRPLEGTALANPQAGEGTGGAHQFRTSNGRQVASGGGITPDVEIAAPILDPWAAFLEQRGVLASFAADYISRHGRPGRAFQSDDQTLAEFHDFLTRGGIRAPEEFWNPDRDYLKQRIRTELINLVEGLSAGNEFATQTDPQVQKAEALFSQVAGMLKPPASKPKVAPPKEAAK
jgi:carboxyl-terminal processing protease